MFHIRVSSNTDVGDIKQTNQDCILIKQSELNGHTAGLFIVADGCGGLSYGEEISNLVVTHFSRVWNLELKKLLQNSKIKTDEADALLERAIKDINDGAVSFGKQVDSKVGSTLSLLLAIDDRYIIKNVGDSRIYLKNKRKITQLTQDQSLVADLIRNGEITQEEAKSFKKKNVLTMCIGAFEEIKTYTKKGKIKNGDTFILCCDGLHNKVSKEKMIEVLSDKKKPFEEAAARMRELILPGEANDNVSSVICEFYKKNKLKHLMICLGVLLALAAAAVGVYVFAFSGGVL